MNKPLPKIKVLTYSLTLPISGETVMYRPYNVSDERLLIAAAAAKDTDKEFYINNTLNVIKQAVVNDIDVTKLPSTDVKFLLLHQRARSVGEVIEFQINKQPQSVNINDFKVVNPRSPDDFKIMIGSDIGIKMRDSTFEEEIKTISTLNPNDNTEEKIAAKVFYKMIINSIESIFDKNDVWVVGQDITLEDAEAFLNDVPSNESKKIYEFVSNAPYIAVDLNIDGELKTITSKEVDFLG